MMKKKKVHVFGNDFYLLGQDKNGINYYLQAATFDCEWYFGVGYVETFTNNTHPERSRDITMHTHFNTLFFETRCNSFDKFNNLFVETPFTEREIWQILELMHTLYTLRTYSDLLHIGGSQITSRGLEDTRELIKNADEYNRINKGVIPAILNKLHTIMGGE